jgi:thioredoxin-related protein
MEGCPHCGQLHRETHADPKVIQALNERFIPVRLEGRSHMDLVQKLGVRGAPTTLLLSPDGKEKHRFVGFFAAADYLKELDKAV